jgi:hypothetical protein
MYFFSCISVNTPLKKSSNGIDLISGSSGGVSSWLSWFECRLGSRGFRGRFFPLSLRSIDCVCVCVCMSGGEVIDRVCGWRESAKLL